MKTYQWNHPLKAVGATLLLCLSAPQAFAEVIAAPATVTFTSPQQSATIALTNDGAPIPAASIQGWQLFASGHDYKHMLNVEKLDGALKIAPSPTIEVGSYDLSIQTASGPVAVRLFAPLSDVPDIIEKTAALTGQSETQIKQKLGMITTTARETIQIDLPPVYYEGQTLELTIANQPNPARSYTWFINGELVAQGPKQNTLTYTFDKQGEYLLTYIETESKDGQITTVARANANTRVVPMPGVPTNVALHAETEFAPPPGFQYHTWRIDGEEVSTEATLKYAFHAVGTHTVECLATSPTNGPTQGFLRIRYNINVN